jgi:hypothetical protein
VKEKKAMFEVGDKVRPHNGFRINMLGTVKEVHDMILTPHSQVTYKVRFDTKSQFGLPDYEDIWYPENELNPNVLSPMGFHKEESHELQTNNKVR